jgi:hypothetical protein
MHLQLCQHAVKPGAPNLGPLLDLFEQMFQRSRAVAVAAPLGRYSRPKSIVWNGKPFELDAQAVGAALTAR